MYLSGCAWVRLGGVCPAGSRMGGMRKGRASAGCRSLGPWYGATAPLWNQHYRPEKQGPADCTHYCPRHHQWAAVLGAIARARAGGVT
eukprot:gene7303-13587_t